jgi:prephenate dehydrogenase
MKVGIVGLGLIGGSFAKAIKAYTKHQVLAFDVKNDTVEFAKCMNVVDSTLNEANIPECDYIIISVYPGDMVNWLKANQKYIKKGAVVIDCCGVKRLICEECFSLAENNGFIFIGGHPMAGYHKSGFKYSRETLFKGATMIIVPHDTNNIELLAGVNSFFKTLGFASVTVTDAETHDKNIAFTSQLAHVVSNAYVKSPRAMVHKGFSAGSYKDLTRVAYLNEVMWTELFMANKSYIKEEIDSIISELKKYSDALDQNDEEQLRNLLKEGRERKELIDK